MHRKNSTEGGAIMTAAVIKFERPAPRPKTPRKPKATALEREAKIFEAGQIIERMLPAYVELHQLWAKGSGDAHAYVDANFSQEERWTGFGSPASLALKSIYKTSGADAAQQAMNALHRKIAPLARMIETAPAEGPCGMRAKTLAAMFECVSGIGDHRGFDFDNEYALEMLFPRMCPRSGIVRTGGRPRKPFGRRGMTVVKYPYSVSRRAHSRRPRTSKRHARGTGGQSRGRANAGDHH
jgi:hypothetical protein